MGSVSELATWESGEVTAPRPCAGSDEMGQEHEIRLDEMNLQNPADSLVEERLRAKTLADLPVGRTPALGNMKCMHGRYKAAAAGFTAFQP